MDSDNTTQEICAATVEFEHALKQLVLETYTKGVPLDDTWEIAVPVADAPDWTVTITKTYSEETSDYDPDFLEE